MLIQALTSFPPSFHVLRIYHMRITLAQFPDWKLYIYINTIDRLTYVSIDKITV